MPIGKLHNMQYKEGNSVKTKDSKIRSNSDSAKFMLENKLIAPTDRKKDIIIKKINPSPDFLSLLPCAVVNSNFSLSNVRGEFRFTNKIAPIIESQKTIPPTGCGIIKPQANPVKDTEKNIKFQKLSLFMREAIKPAFGIFGIPNSSCLASFLNLKDSVKSSIFNTYYRFNILELILPRIRTLFKIITCATLCLLIFILGNTRAYATDNIRPNAYLLKKYIGYVERKNRIPRGLLNAIVAVESGFNPYSVNITGKPFTANNKLEAVKTIKDALNQGITNIDVGIAQINYRWHKDNFKNIEEMLSPTTNIEYAAKLLSSLFKRYGTWQDAIKYYHSANSDYHRQYSRKVVTTWLSNTYLLTIK